LEARVPILTHKRLPGLCSEHFPNFLDCGGLHGGRRYFKFKNMWIILEVISSLIMDNLSKRHVIVVDWCCMCK
jgi:hypothetical protein